MGDGDGDGVNSEGVLLSQIEHTHSWDCSRSDIRRHVVCLGRGKFSSVMCCLTSISSHTLHVSTCIYMYLHVAAHEGEGGV